MGMREFFREKKWKKLKKDQWLILFLAGVLLLVIAVPASCGGSDSGAGLSSGRKMADSAAAGEETVQTDVSVYREEMEERLEQVLSQMEGVGRVSVMITLKDEGEAVVEKDVSVNGSSTDSTDSGGKRTEEEKSEHSEETVYRAGASDGEPFVSKQITPGIEGVLVVAEGGGDTVTAKNISEAVQALFPVEAHKIKVVKSDLQEGSG